MEEKEFELFDYLNILWKRRWFIVIGTVVCMVLTGIISFLVKPVYEVDAIIQPGKFVVENQAGNFEEVVVEDPQQVADKVQHRSYDALIAAQLNIEEEELPELKAENIEDTLLTRIWVRESDVSQGKRILHTLVGFLKGDMDKKIAIEFDNIDAEINENEIDRERSLQEIEILKNKIKIIDQRKKDIAAEMKSAKEKIGEIEKEQMAVLKKENRTDIESLGLLLYSNEIQQSMQYLDLLNEKLKIERLEEENVYSDLKEEEATISKINNTIANLKERKGRIDETKVVKEPTSSIYPVYPRKKLNVLIAGIMGLMLLSVLVFFLDYTEKHKAE
jgi:capsular polysaccharide biosynthesis protein